MKSINETIRQLDLIVTSKLNKHQELQTIFNNIDLDITGDLINYYLDKIKNNFNKNINIKECDAILTNFDYNFGVSNFEIRKYNYSIMEEANIITDDLIKKLFNTNNRSITLPINFTHLIEYTISNFINYDDIDRVLYYILIKLVVIYNLNK